MRNPDLPTRRGQLPATRRGQLPATRRGLLGSGLAGIVALVGLGATAGCDPFTEDAPKETGPHPLDGLLAGTVALAGRYEAVVAAVPALAGALTPVLETHRRHATVLSEAVGRPLPTAAAPVEPAPTARAAAITALATAEKAARDEAVTACLAASPRLAALLGTVAAARACHLEILR